MYGISIAEKPADQGDLITPQSPNWEGKMSDDDLTLIFSALAVLQLPTPIKPEPEDMDAAIRRGWAGAGPVSDAYAYSSAQARFVVRKVTSYYRARNEHAEFVNRMEERLKLDDWPLMN